MAKNYYRQNIKKLNEEKIINLVFENNKNLYKPLDYISEAGILPSLKTITNPSDATKRDAKDSGKSILNFMAFNKICRNIAASLNKNWTLKRATGAVVKDIYQQSIVVLAFFYRSKFKLIVWRGFNKYYSWDLAMASILLYESYKNDSGISYAYTESAKVSPTSLKDKITSYFNKIRNKTLSINTTTLDIEDADAIADGSRDRSDTYNAKNEADELITTISNVKLLGLSSTTPDTIKKLYQNEKARKTWSAETNTYIDNICIALDEIQGFWNNVTAPDTDELEEALKKSLGFIPFAMSGNPSIVDSSSDIITFGIGGTVNVVDGSDLNDIKGMNPRGIDAKKIKTKIIYSYVRNKLTGKVLVIFDKYINSNKYISSV
jgi:hypothetical protein